MNYNSEDIICRNIKTSWKILSTLISISVTLFLFYPSALNRAFSDYQAKN